MFSMRHWEENETMLKILFPMKKCLQLSWAGEQRQTQWIKDLVLSYLNPNASVTFSTSFSTNLHMQSINSSAVVVDYFPGWSSFLRPCYHHCSLWPQHLSTNFLQSLYLVHLSLIKLFPIHFSHFYESFYPSIKNNKNNLCHYSEKP